MEGTGKLVRDRVPELMKSGGEQPRTRVAHGEEYPALLRVKLLEEVQEFLESGEADELVDVIEVVYALARELGVDPEKLEKLRATKEKEQGGFGEHTVLVAPAEEPAPEVAPASS